MTSSGPRWWSSGNSQQLVGLEAKPPPGVGQAIGYRLAGMSHLVGAAQGLEEEMPEVELGKGLRRGPGLGVDQLQLVTGA